MRYVHDQLWAGTELALHAYLALEAQAEEKLAAGWLQPVPPEEAPLPYLLSIDNGIARVRVHGPLTNKEAWYNEFLGIASYGAIRDALVTAAGHPEVAQIVLDINSGGGAVSGVSDTADLIRLINDRVKPVTAYTDGTMASAAYWLGVSAGEVYASNVATVGSIGIIATHAEYSQQLKADGVNVTVMRAGKFKALANSMEPLTESAKEQMQSQLDAAYQVFVSYVANATGKSYDYVDAHMAQGREFFGQQALAAGLVDGIVSYDGMMTIVNSKTIDKNYRVTHNPAHNPSGTNNMNKKALSEQELAALASGAQSQTLTAAEVEVAAQQAAADADAEAQAAAEQAEAPESAQQQAAEAPNATLVTFLQGEVKAKDEVLLQANVKLAQLEAQLADQEASHQALLTIASKSANNMQIALGGSATDLSSLSATAVLAHHQKISEEFQRCFRAGGVAAVDAAAKKDEPELQLDPLRQARLDAVRFSKAK